MLTLKSGHCNLIILTPVPLWLKLYHFEPTCQRMNGHPCCAEFSAKSAFKAPLFKNCHFKIRSAMSWETEMIARGLINIAFSDVNFVPMYAFE